MGIKVTKSQKIHSISSHLLMNVSVNLFCFQEAANWQTLILFIFMKMELFANLYHEGWWKLILFISLKMARNWKYLLRFCHLYLRMEVPNPAHSLSFFSLSKHCGRALLPVNVLLHSCKLHLPIVNFLPHSSRLLKTFQLKLKPRISSFFKLHWHSIVCQKF